MRFSALLTLRVCLPAFCQDCSKTIAINVVDPQTGRFIWPLQPEIFEGRIGNRTLPLTDLKRIEKSRILVLIDASRSMKDPDERFKFEPHVHSKFLENLNGVVRQVSERTAVGYGIFAKQSLFAPGFTSNTAALGANIDELLARPEVAGIGEHTALYDALHEA